MPIQWQDYIEERKDVMLGKPVFKGTRLTVEHILKELGTGMSQEEVLAGYPQISAEHLKAALLYSAAVIGMDDTIYA
jgi:uncharacterized protein (DUF433 family)